MEDFYEGPLLAFRVLNLWHQLRQERNIWRWLKLRRELGRAQRALKQHRQQEGI